MNASGSISEPRVRGEDELQRCECCGAAKDGSRPKAEVGELHTFDATPILRMTASAYNRPVGG